METAQSTAMARQAEFAQIAASELDAALSEGEIEVFLLALQKVIRAGGGFSAVARKTGLNRTALYKTASSSGNPTLSTLIALLPLAGLRLSVEPLGDSESGVQPCVGIELAEAVTT
jgi:probable addiction module antidote protein